MAYLASNCASCVSKTVASCDGVRIVVGHEATTGMQGDLEPVRGVAGGLGGGEHAVGVDVRRRAHALPVRDYTTRRALLLHPVEVEGGAAGCVAGRVVVAAHHDGGLLPARQVPEVRAAAGCSRSIWVIRLTSSRCCSSACGIAILLVLIQCAVEHVVRADAGHAVALLACPGRVALARVNHRAGEVVGEGGSLTAVRADRAAG